MLVTRRPKLYVSSQDITEQFIEAKTAPVLKAAYLQTGILGRHCFLPLDKISIKC